MAARSATILARYWEGRWRDEKAENERLRAVLKLIDDYYQTGGDLMPHVSHLAKDALDANLPTAADVRGILKD